MRFTKSVSTVLLIAAFVFINAVTPIIAQETRGALLRGYRTGYSDGYMAGYRDSVERAARNFAKKSEYTKANRVYRSEYGSIEEYRDGYQQGFEGGYNTGFDRQAFDAALPTNLALRTAKTVVSPDVEKVSNDGDKIEKNRDAQSTVAPPVLQESLPKSEPPAVTGEPVIIIPTNTEIVVEMLADVDTENSREGDTFLARVVAPEEIKGATIEGLVAKIKKPGRVKGNAELQLSFSRIVLNANRWANFNAVVIEALPSKGNNIKAIDEEGTVRGKSSLKSDVIKVSAATGTGATVGVIAGGPVGAAIGAAVGGAIGVGGVLVERGKEINLTQGQQLRVRTNFESQIR